MSNKLLDMWSDAEDEATRQHRDCGEACPNIVSTCKSLASSLRDNGVKVRGDFSQNYLMVLSICTSAGLLDRAFLDAGHEVTPGCEIMEHKRDMYRQWCGDHEFICHDLADLPAALSGCNTYDLIIGGPSCQSHSKLKSINPPKFPDLTPLVVDAVENIPHRAYMFENVVAIDIPGSKSVKLNAMHFPELHNGNLIHQSRERWFTYHETLTPPKRRAEGTRVELMAYSIVAGKIYGAEMGSILQGWPEFRSVKAKSPHRCEALADGVPRGLSVAWISAIEKSLF